MLNPLDKEIARLAKKLSSLKDQLNTQPQTETGPSLTPEYGIAITSAGL